MKGRTSATREIKARLNIIDIVKRYVDLRRMGNRWVAPCPFHQETKPSFSVNEDEGFFYCFGCQAAGDVFDFYSRINGLEFRETLEQLAQEAGVTLSDVRADPKASAERDLRKKALRMYEVAVRHYQANLAGANGAACRNYLTGRKLAPEIIEGFELGWSLPEWEGVAAALRRAGFSAKDGVDAGLLVGKERGGGYDRFRSRLMFPIKNLSGQTIAFGGRIIGDEDAAKYINSSDSPLYKKGDNLYGLFQARRGISAQKFAILTEGYMDVLTLHQFGYSNACGVLGTALTPEQVRRLAGFCSHLELIFDGDGPGRKAALRACEMVLAKGMACRVVLLPDKEDIDSLLQNEGKAAFEDVRRFAPEGLDFCIRTLSAGSPREALEWVKSFIAAVEQPELVSRFISRLSQGLGLDEREMRKGLENKLSASGGKAAAAVDAPLVAPKDALDRRIMSFVVRCPQHLPSLGDSGAMLLLSQGWALSLWEKIAACGPDYDSDDVLRSLDDKEREFWWHHRVKEAPPLETQDVELADICATAAAHLSSRQDKACKQALMQEPDKNSYDPDVLKALNETLLRKRARWSSDG